MCAFSLDAVFGTAVKPENSAFCRKDRTILEMVQELDIDA
jgi:hypothetical protein